MFTKKNQEVAEQPDKTADLAAKKEENERLFEQLTNKNREYMVKLNRSLDDRNVSEDRKTVMFNDMLKNIVDQQDQHLTARRIYGTVTDQANYLTENPSPDEQTEFVRSEPWKIYLDGALMLGGLFSGIQGIGYLFGNDNSSMRLVVLILAFLLGGLALMVITKYAPIPGQKGGFLKYILATTAAMVGFVLFMSLGAYAPAVINPIIPGPALIVVAVIAIGAKIYLKRKLNIKGTLI